MDLDLWQRPAFPKLRIPYMCTKYPYDGVDFFGFPARSGWLLKERSDIKQRWEMIELARRDEAVPSIEETTAFLQAWLFFGTLREILKISEIRIELKDFVETVHGIEMVSTAPLHHYRQLWTAKELELGSGDADFRVQGVMEILEYVENFAISCSSHPENEILNLNETIAAEEPYTQVYFSITVLCRYVRICISQIFPGQDIPPLPGQRFFARCGFLSTSPEKIMLSSGCCKSEIDLVRSRLTGPTFFFASFLHRPYMSRNHHDCTKLECMAAQIDTETYQTKHVLPSCDCGFIGSSGSNLADVLRSGRIPRIRIDADEDCFENTSMKVVCDGPYIAISHVWSHGLGNQHSNSLPRCQILLLKKYLEGFRRSLNYMGLFDIWIDTLCIPVEPEFIDSRRIAIQMIPKTFDDAHSILVIDIELYTSSMKSSLLEIGLRILCAGWMRRLWTLLEGVQGIVQCRNKLHFQFKEGSIPYHAFLGIALNPEIDPTNLYLCKKVCRALESSLPGFSSIASKSDRMFFRMCEVSRGAKGRTTSRMTDEPVCIAILLGLPTATILEGKSAAQRMRELYLLIRDFPTRIIFSWTLLPINYSDGSRLTEIPGFGWAKRSLMADKDVMSNVEEKDSRWATCLFDGLHGEYFGFVFDDIQEVSQTALMVRDVDSALGYIIMADPGREVQWAESCKQFGNSTRAAIIFDDLDVEHSFRVVLAQIREERDGILYIRCVAKGQHRTFMSLERKPFIKDRVISLVRGTSPSPITVPWVTGRFTSPNQRWCII